MIKLDIATKLREYRRVLQIARKPDKEEFLVSAKISSIGIIVIGGIGFIIFMAFIFIGI
ncbi:MAG: protein translocase SEC61 complex subunit gamma [Candidatus Aenigmarchaeota archaeon]|nr:protein translocase SEC61 complex subunit gamma [Candidatus Aenigmarchaeota archaeon]